MACLMFLPMVSATYENQFIHQYNLENGNDVNGTLTLTNDGASFVAGKFLNGVYFNGATQDLSGAGTPLTSAQIQSNWTINFWLNQTSRVNDSQAFSFITGATGQTIRFHPQASSCTGSPAFGGYDGASFTKCLTGRPSYLNQWVMYTLVYNVTTGNILVYENTVNTINISMGAFGSTARCGTGVTLGQEGNCGALGSNAYVGMMDSLGFWTTTLNKAEIDKLYLSQSPFNVSGPAGNVSITLTDFYTSASLTNFSATAVNSSGYQYNGTTTTGTLNDWTYTFLTTTAGLWNITLASTENGGYFSRTLLNQNVSSAITSTLAQSDITFYGVEKVTNNNISGMTFSTQYLTNTTHYMRAQSYVVNSSKSGYYNATMTYTPTALLTATVPFYNISNQSLNLTVRYLLNNSAVPSFTVYVANSTYGFSESYSVTGSQITLNLTSNIGYTISVNVTNAFSNTTSFISAYNQSNLTVYVASTTQLNVFFFDEETLQAVSNVNYTVVGSTYALNGSTANNNINFSALNNDNYEIRYTQNGGNYTSRSYFIRIPLTTASESNISLYLLKVNISTTFTLYVTDKYDLPKPNLTVSLLRRYPINGQTVYYVVEQMKPSYALDGQTIFSGVANNVPYLFRVVNDEGNVVFQGSGSTANNLQTLYLISNPIYIRVTLDTNPFTIAQDLEGVSANLSNTSTTFWYNVQDTNNALDQICLKVIGNTSLQVYNYCSDDTSSILSYVPSNGNNLSYYTAYGYVVIDGVQRVLKTAQIDFRTNNSFRIYGNFGIFLTLLSIIIVSVAFADKPMFMVIGIALSLLAFGTQALGFIWLSPTLQATILVLSIIVAYIMRND